jgi:hypothetical protein
MNKRAFATLVGSMFISMLAMNMSNGMGPVVPGSVEDGRIYDFNPEIISI